VFLDIAQRGAAAVGVGCPGVAEVMRGDGLGEFEAAAGIAHGTLDVCLVEVEADFARAVGWVFAGFALGEEPCPAFGPFEGGELAGEAAGELDGDACGNIVLPDGDGMAGLRGECGEECAGEGNDAVFIAFAAVNDDGGVFEFDISEA